MSYFYNNKLYDYYQLTESSIGSSVITKDVIEIINNEKILFDFSNLFVQSPSLDVLNFSDVETTKIRIDWGDGLSDRLNLPLVSNKSSIGSYRPNQWKIIEHFFNVKKRYEYKTNEIEYLHKITITVYNSFNDKLTIHIPYKMVYKTLYDLGSEISMFSSNITNKNDVSYTLKQKSTDSLFVVKSKDWRSIYGDEETEIIEESVSEIFSDEFVNKENITWDWKSVPVVTLIPEISNIEKYIKCSFVQRGVKIDTWTPSIELLNDKGNIQIKTVKNQGFNFQSDVDDLESGVYAVYLKHMTGINGVEGQSNKSFVLFDTNIRPRQLMKRDDDVFVIDETNNKIIFNYTLPLNHQVKSLTKAELLLSAEYQDEEYRKEHDISDIRFSYNLLTPLFDKNGNPNYCNCSTECTGDCRSFSYNIPMRNIPNVIHVDGEGDKKIQYNVKVLTNDVLGEADNELFYQENDDPNNSGLLKVYDLSKEKIKFDNYTIGSFGDQGLIINTIDDISKKLNINWNFTKQDDWDEFRVKMTCVVDGKEYLVLNDVHEHKQGDSFDGLINDNGFNKIVDGNKVPNGVCTVDVDYIVEMADFYDVRKKTCSKTFTYTYPTPKLTIDDICAYTYIDFDKSTQIQSLKLVCDVISNYSEEPLKYISVNVNDEVYQLSELKYTHVIPSDDESTYTFSFSASNFNDIFNREGISDYASFSVTDKLDTLLSLPSNGNDYLGIDDGRMFIKTDNQEVIDWLWLKQNTLHDVNKSVVYEDTINNRKYFGGFDNKKFTFNDNPICVVYDILEVVSNGVYYRRFIPYKGSTTSEIFQSPTNLMSCDDIITDKEIHTLYTTINDTGQLLIRWNSSKNLTDQKEISQIKDMWLKLYYDGEEIQTVDIKGLREYTFQNLNFGDYSYEIILNSEWTATDKNTSLTKDDIISLLVPLDKAIEHAGSPSKSIKDENSTYVTFKWKLNHVNCKNVRFCYQVNDEEIRYIDYVRIQNYTQTPAITNGSIIKYWFEMESSSLEGKPVGWEKINERTLTV